MKRLFTIIFIVLLPFPMSLYADGFVSKKIVDVIGERTHKFQTGDSKEPDKADVPETPDPKPTDPPTFPDPIEKYCKFCKEDCEKKCDGKPE